MTQAVAKVMVDQGVKNGSIMNLASIVGKVRKIWVLRKLRPSKTKT